jgi:hypothetical protein
MKIYIKVQQVPGDGEQTAYHGNVDSQRRNRVRTYLGFKVVDTLVDGAFRYTRLKERCSSHNVISRYRPTWLGGQHWTFTSKHSTWL